MNLVFKIKMLHAHFTIGILLAQEAHLRVAAGTCYKWGGLDLGALHHP